jgi:sulfur carrier protein ThiS
LGLVRAEVKLGDKQFVLEVSEGSTVKALLGKLESKWRGNVLVLVNGKAVGLDDLLHPSDRIWILPLLAGG